MTKQERKFHTDNHQRAAETHAALAKAMTKCANSHGEMAKACEVADPGMSQNHTDLASACEEAAGAHIEAGDFHLSCLKTIGELPSETGGSTGKADSDELLDQLRKLLGQQLVSTNVSVVPRIDRPTLIPRTGQPDPRTAKAPVDPVLEGIIFDQT